MYFHQIYRQLAQLLQFQINENEYVIQLKIRVSFLFCKGDFL